MTNFPTTRQLAPSAQPAPVAPLVTLLEGNANAHPACGEALAQAFSTFSQAAGSLESTYLALHDELQLLRRELAGTSLKLRASLSENQRTRQHLEDILRCLPCGVVVADDHGRIVRRNPTAERLLSQAAGRELAPGADWNSLSKPDRVPGFFAGAGESEVEYTFTEEPAASSSRTYGICRSKISRFAAKSNSSTSQYFAELAADAESSNFPAATESAAADGAWVYIIRDLTREKTLLQEREAARRLSSLAEVSAVLAHEIRNPLASLELFAGLIAKSADPSSHQAVWINHIRAGLRALSGTVNNVLQLYSQSAPQATPLDLSELLLHTCDFLRPLADQWQVRIEPELPANACLVPGVAHQLQQVLLNIAMNAFRVSPPGGALRITLAPSGGAIRITITDDGPGIAPEMAERIFEPGFSTRADSPGIGLAVSRKIIEQHGGTLTASNAPGHGASFRITLPCADTATRTAGGASLPPERFRQDTQQIPVSPVAVEEFSE